MSHINFFLGAQNGMRLSCLQLEASCLQWSFFYLQLTILAFSLTVGASWLTVGAFFAYSGKVRLIRALRDCMQRSLTASKRAPTVSKKTKHRVVADVWEKDVWDFQAKSGSSGSCRLFLHFLGKIAVQGDPWKSQTSFFQTSAAFWKHPPPPQMGCLGGGQKVYWAASIRHPMWKILSKFELQIG